MKSALDPAPKAFRQDQELGWGDDLLWALRSAVLSQVRDPTHPDYTLRQLAVLLVLAQGQVRPTVRHLAAHLRLSKPALTRGFNTLEATGAAVRRADQHDLRSVEAQLTVLGTRRVRALAAAFASPPPPV